MWPGLRRRLAPLLAGLVLAGALLYVFLALWGSVWCYYTDDVSIRENALVAKPRLVVWEEPQRILGARDASAVARQPAFSPDGATLVFSNQPAGETNVHLYASQWDGRTWSKPAPMASSHTPPAEKNPAITRDGRYCYFASDQPGGYGGFDLYSRRVIRGERQPARNLGMEINSPADDLAPAVRMEDFNLVYSSSRGAGVGKKFNLYSTTAREVVGKLDLSRLDALLGRLFLVKWWILAVIVALLLLIYLIRHYRDLTNLFHKCLMASAIVHLLALLLVSFWKIGAQMADKEVPAKTEEVAIDVDALAGDKLALDMAENMIGRTGGGGGGGDHTPLAGSEITVVARQADKFLPAPDFQPQRSSPGPMTVARSTVNPAVLEEAPSRAQESSGGREIQPPAGADQALIKATAQLDVLPEMASPRVDVVMENKTPGASLPAPAEKPTFQPLVNRPSAATVQADKFLPAPDFQPQRSGPGALAVARRTVEPVALEDAPVRAQESSGDRAAQPSAGAAQEPVNAAAPLDALPEIAAPRVDVVMESKEPGTSAKISTENPTFQPLMNMPMVSTQRVQYAVGVGTVASARPVNIAPGVHAVAVVAPAGGSEKTSLAFGTGSGTGALDTLDTGGRAAVLSRGGDESSGPHALSGLGEVLTARLASIGSGHGRGPGSGPGLGAGNGGGLGRGRGTGLGGGQGSGMGSGQGPGMGSGQGPGLVDGGPGLGMGRGPGFGDGRGDGVGTGVPDKLEVPEELGEQMSPYALRKAGKPSSALVEALGGSKETEASVSRALEWLARHQEPDGRWSIEKYGGQRGHDHGASGLSLLCFLGAGVKPQEPGSPHQPVAAKALAWLSAQVKADGDARGAGDMYDQGIVTIALAEAFALTKDQALGRIVSRAAGFIVRAQHPATGGWRYQPGQPGDTSVFGWQLMALMSARMAGLHVPQETIDRADQWLTVAGGGERGGLYGYENKNVSPSMTAEGMFCRQLLGFPSEDARMVESAGYLINALPPVHPNVDFYYLYYGTLAMNQYRGPAWNAWNARLKLVLPPLQSTTGDEAGSWAPTERIWGAMGRVVSTALATLSLEIYYRYLPFAFAKGLAAAPAEQAAPDR